MASWTFSGVDVFGSASRNGLAGNPVAVVHDAQGLDDDTMAAFASWTNLSETTFLLPPTEEGADYRLRIFTPEVELPFAGHPTLGSAHAWLEQGGASARHEEPTEVVQQCGVGLVRVRDETPPGAPTRRLAFAAPPLSRSGPIDDETLQRALAGLGVDASAVLASAWVVNGPNWMGLLLDSAERVLALEPDFTALHGLEVGVIGEHPRGSPADFEVRAFCPGVAVPEDPVTGSLNAGLATWLTGAGHAPPSYRARQGTCLGRAGDVRVTTDDAGTIWVGGACHTVVAGRAEL